MFWRSLAFALVLYVTLVVFTACGGSSSPSGASSGELSNDTPYEGPANIVISVSEETLPEPLDVTIERTELTPALPEGLEPLGPTYELFADKDVLLEEGSFELSVPLPKEFEANEVALALYTTDAQGEQAWFPVYGLLNENRNRHVTKLSMLRTEPLKFQVVAAPPITRNIPEDESISVQSHADFIISCLPGTCKSRLTSFMRDTLLDTSHELADRGFKKPKIDKLFLFGPPIYITQLHKKETPGCTTPWGDFGGYYLPIVKLLVVCIDQNLDLDDKTDGAKNRGQFKSTIVHEFFHAVQQSHFNLIATISDKKRYVVEGTAALAELSYQYGKRLERNDRRPLFRVNRSLLSTEEIQAYRAQDFWLYIGRQVGEGIGFLQTILDGGYSLNRIDDTLESYGISQISGLSRSYYSFVYYHTFERDYKRGISGNMCAEIAPVYGGTAPDEWIYDPVNPQTLRDRSFELEPLSSVIRLMTFLPGTESYEVSVSGTNNFNDETDYYALTRIVDLDTCTMVSDGGGHETTITTTQRRFAVLTSNLNQRDSAVVDMEYSVTVDPTLYIDGATQYDENDPIELQPRVVGADVSEYEIDWFLDDGFEERFIGQTKDGEPFTTQLCSLGDVQIFAIAYEDAERDDPDKRLSASIELTVVDPPDIVPERCRPAVAIHNPRDEARVSSSSVYELRAVYDDDRDQPITDRQPLYPFVWNISGPDLSSATYTTSEPYLDVNFELEGEYNVQVTYSTAEDTITLNSVTTNNQAPDIRMLVPDVVEERIWSEGDVVFDTELAASVSDPEDEDLDIESVFWQFRVYNRFEILSTWQTCCSDEAQLELPFEEGTYWVDVRAFTSDSAGFERVSRPHSIKVVGPDETGESQSIYLAPGRSEIERSHEPPG